MFFSFDAVKAASTFFLTLDTTKQSGKIKEGKGKEEERGGEKSVLFFFDRKILIDFFAF